MKPLKYIRSEYLFAIIAVYGIVYAAETKTIPYIGCNSGFSVFFVQFNK